MLCIQIDTFGFQTARHYGAEIVKNLMVDAHTTSRWYYVIAMGRKAGHLALGIGKAAGATLTLIPEEFGLKGIRLKTITDTLVGAIIKRLASGKKHGVAVIAEGVVEGLDPLDVAGLEGVERDAHGHLRIAEVAIGQILKQAVQNQLKEFGLNVTIVAKDIGYELRCADPIPYDVEYSRDLGYCAAKYLLSGGVAVMVSLQGGQIVPIPFVQLLDPKKEAKRVREIDLYEEIFTVAHDLYERGGRVEGRDLDNWLEAERIVRTLRKIAGVEGQKYISINVPMIRHSEGWKNRRVVLGAGM